MVTKLHKELLKTRLARKMTLRDIEAESEGQISNGYYSQLERGKMIEPSPPKLRVIARILKLDYIELLYLAGYLTRAEKASLT